MNVLIVGYYGFRNLGDEAILSAMLGELGALLPGAEFVITSGEPDLTAKQHRVKAVHWRDIPAIAKAVADSDVVVLGGGGLFHDLWGFAGETLLSPDHWGIPFFAGPAVLASLNRKPLVLYGVGLEGIADPKARQMTRAVFDLSWAASVRDRISASFLSDLGFGPDRYAVTADPAWLLTSGRARGSAVRRPGRAATEVPCIGVSLRAWDVGVDIDAWLAEVAGAVGEFAESVGARVLLLPFQTLEGEAGYDDRTAARALAERIANPDIVDVVPAPEDAEAAIQLFSQCDLVLGMRYHALLLAAGAGTPVVGLAYAPKVRGLMEQLEMGELCFSPGEVGRKQLGAALHEAWESRTELSEGLSGARKRLVEMAQHNGRLVKEVLDGGAAPPDPTPGALSLVADAASEAVVRAAERTAEVLNLVTERDWSQGQRYDLAVRLEELQGWHEELKEERDGLVSERDRLGSERDSLAAERDSLADELGSVRNDRDALRDKSRQLEEELGNLEAGHAALQDAHHELQSVFGQITSSRAYRVVTAIWGLRMFVRRAPRAALQLPRRLLKRRERPEKASNVRSWEALAFERFKEAMAERFSGIVVRAVPRRPLHSITVIVPLDDAGGAAGTLESLREQTFRELEILLMAPESSRAERETLRSLQEADDRVRVVDSEEECPAGLLWEGVGACSGDAVLWLQAGDLAHPSAVARLAERLSSNPAYDAVCAQCAPEEDPAHEGEAGSAAAVPTPVGPPLATFNLEPEAHPDLVVLCRRELLDIAGAPGEHVGGLGVGDLVARLNDLGTIGSTAAGGPPLFLRKAISQAGAAVPEGPGETATAIEVFDDFRRDLLLGVPVLWEITGANDSATEEARRLRDHAVALGDLVALPGEEQHVPGTEPRLWLPSVRVKVCDGGSESEQAAVGGGASPRFRIVARAHNGSGDDPDGGWDLSVKIGREGAGIETRGARSWEVESEEDAVTLIRLLADMRHLRRFEAEVAGWQPAQADLEASVIVCTHMPIVPLAEALASLGRQDMAPNRFEVIVVNNNPGSSELRDALDTVYRERLSGSGVSWREVACPVPGLSHARNAGIAAARGEVLLFLDDDAVAPANWVSQGVRLFSENPSVGVMGGYIRLIPPEPRPSVLGPGWGRYWSHFSGSEQSLYTVEEWWDFPWGASWCARRSVLLGMGGFRTRFGRKRHDFAGGEEVVAASLARRLGWEIAVAPELEVEHRVVPERFTWAHVRRTILVGTLGNYRMQRDRYIPMDGTKWTLRCLLSPSFDRTVGADSLLARLRHWSYRKRAWARLLVWQLRDERRRRKPSRY